MTPTTEKLIDILCKPANEIQQKLGIIDDELCKKWHDYTGIIHLHIRSAIQPLERIINDDYTYIHDVLSSMSDTVELALGKKTLASGRTVDFSDNKSLRSSEVAEIALGIVAQNISMNKDFMNEDFREDDFDLIFDNLDHFSQNMKRRANVEGQNFSIIALANVLSVVNGHYQEKRHEWKQKMFSSSNPDSKSSFKPPQLKM